jgi:hypothetical protein
VSIESDLYLIISGICPRVYPDIAPANTAMPYVTWSLYGGNTIKPLAKEVPDKRNAMIQVNVWSKSRLESINTMLAIESALITATQFVCKPMNAMSATFDDDTDIRGIMQDFSIWGPR